MRSPTTGLRLAPTPNALGVNQTTVSVVATPTAGNVHHQTRGGSELPRARFRHRRGQTGTKLYPSEPISRDLRRRQPALQAVPLPGRRQFSEALALAAPLRQAGSGACRRG